MEINMAKFIDEYLQREGITKERAEELKYKISETTSLSKFTEFEFNAIKTMCGADILTSSECRALVLMMCNEKLGIKYEDNEDA